MRTERILQNKPVVVNPKVLREKSFRLFHPSFLQTYDGTDACEAGFVFPDLKKLKARNRVETLSETLTGGVQ